MTHPAQPLKIVIVGITGRTGSQVGILAQESQNFETAAGVASAKSGKSAAKLSALGLISDTPIVQSLKDAPSHDVVIDFSTPELSCDVARTASRLGSALVVGTTGLTPAGMEALEAAASTVPVVYSPNMSVGVNLLFALTQKTAAALSGSWDIEIVEAHHKHKVDAPSGTAVKLAKVAEEGTSSPKWVHGREGAVGARLANEIGIHAMRGGDVVGEHTVFFMGDGERIELTHRATDRKIFAQGALQAAAWARGQAPGLYSMSDVLGLG